MIDPAAHARLERWKLSLLDLSAANRLIDVRDGAMTIPLPAVDPVALAAALSDGAGFAIEAGPAIGDGAIDAGKLRSPLARPELVRRLTAIRRAARAQLADGGVHTLWLGLGMLVWSEAPPDATAAVEAAPAAGPAAAIAVAGDGAAAATVDAAPAAAIAVEAGPAIADDTAPAAAPGPAAAAAEPVLRRAPLALWPVDLVREPGGGFRLVEAAGLDPRCNQTLREKLRRELGVVLPDGDAGEAGDAGDELDLAGLLAAAEAIAAERPGWRVERAAELAIFGFAKFAMWNDLDARADELLDSPVVAHLARGAGTAFAQPSPDAAAAVGGARGAAGAASRAASHDVLAPLDADASQLAAVAAAGAGASFVLQGPPGTGKSQTIANLIAHAIAHGRTVLFVTDKVAALEVVHQRLSAVGLGEACLALHSHRAVRAQVVGQLGRVLERAFRPLAGPAGPDARLGELRAALDDHAAAMHRTGPLGRSLHQVLGRL
ncbi:MAG TPA: DUF4011 domain-containing protein, partial [Kofleriaceae bacterium]|nr:DUF4011 domain-containing protein [Kofleriaceae bacterium]